eukprot:756246-Hanusia_phi.AAC.2
MQQRSAGRLQDQPSEDLSSVPQIPTRQHVQKLFRQDVRDAVYVQVRPSRVQVESKTESLQRHHVDEMIRRHKMLLEHLEYSKMVSADETEEHTAIKASLHMKLAELQVPSDRDAPALLLRVHVRKPPQLSVSLIRAISYLPVLPSPYRPSTP